MDAELEGVEIVFAQKLASGDPKIRLRALRRLRDHIKHQSSQYDFDEENFLRLSKGLHYVLWMQDKMILQEGMADNICELTYLFKSEDQSIGFLRALLQTLSKEWPLIDRWRMDKFLLLVRRMFRTVFCHLRDAKWNDQLVHKYLNFFKETVITANSKICDSLKSHCASIYLDELDLAGGLTDEQTIEFLRPWAEVLKTNISDYLFRAICDEVFDLILQQFSEELFESNYEEIEEEQSKDNDDEDEDMEAEHDSDDEPVEKSRAKLSESHKTTINFDYAKIAEILFEVGKRPAINAKRRKRIYSLMQKHAFRLRRFIASFTPNNENRTLVVEFKDGTKGIYPYVWLRDCSLDPRTYSIGPAMKARMPFMRDFDIDIKPESVSLDEKENCLKIDWPENVLSRYTVNWLKTRNLDDLKVRELRRKFYLTETRTWNAEEINKRLKKFDHNDVMIDDKAIHDFLTAVCVDGIAVIKNGPKNDRHTVDKIGDRIGLIHRTHFGKVFEVTTKPDASNMAYATGGELPYHTDFPSLSQPPELQMLHVIKSADEGGLSMFVDGFRIAELLRKEHPDVFETLTKTYIEYIEEGFDVHDRDGKAYKFDFDMVARHKVIRLDEEGRVIKVQFGNAMRSWFFDKVDPHELHKVYYAYKKFTEYCYNPKNQLIFKMDDGDTVLWANTRLLHARSAYRSAPGNERSLMGCYFMWDIVKSKIRLLRDQLDLPNNQLSV